MPTPPTFTKVNPADQPILYLVITSATLPPWTVDEYAETRIAQRISQVTGVAQVQVLGSQKYAVHAQVDPHALAARQIGINEVQAALRNWNANVPTGSMVGRQHDLRAAGERSADERRAVQGSDRRVQQRRAGPAVGCRHGDRRRRGSAHGLALLHRTTPISRPSCSAFSASPAPTRWRSRMR